MKLILRQFGIALVWVIMLGVVCFFPVGCDNHPGDTQGATEKVLFTCGMHPQVIQDHPGNCPICGMKLTPVRKQPTVTAGATNNPASNDSNVISIDPVTTQNMGLRTGIVTRGPLRRTLRTLGEIDFDETALAEVSTKFRGWIERLYVDTTGKQVHAGEPLFEIYSPELYSAQVEYLLALDQAGKGISGADSLRASALTKLKFFDISDEQISDLSRTKTASKTLSVHAPRDGIVVEKMVVQGQMVEAGMKLYRLADLSMVWVLSQVYEQDLAFLKLGQEVTVRISYLADREFRGRVTYIYPTLDEKTRTVRVRMEFHNPGFFLKPGMFATVEIKADLDPSALLVPDSAVLRSGQKNTVFVALDGGRFYARTVKLGPYAENNMYQVLSGLDEGDRIVISGQFMLDSESQLREAIQKMRPTASTDLSSDASPTNITTAPVHETNAIAAYICPMPEHVAIHYDRPGKCPICGMNLVPVNAAALARLQPGGRVDHYTCPMPEHSDVIMEKPGKCPKCGMTLIPVMEPPPPAPEIPPHHERSH